EALVGIEVPLSHPRRVSLRQVIESEGFTDIAVGSGLPIGIGQDVDGEWVALDLGELPHLLIAGATGTGKSVCLGTIVASLMCTRSPEQVRFLMVDPKGVELTPFEASPHLLAPVVVDPSDFAPVLDGLVQVMQQRYVLFRKVNTRNIRSYNEQVFTPLPYLVMVVDELAELMLGGGRDAESTLVRLAQMGRAAGIHLVLSTQRPTVDVVTGLLKANISTRIGFAVASQTDSRVILDLSGAEALLGQGDMLLLGRDSPLPRRVQGAFVEEDELARIVGFWSNPRYEE
ncbi:MAG: FtsK/SpoIIIE domain-containing protein, partial [Gemmatimonadota bacterium]|nr:FtsK/SpoIIIE domain-containing protein [Gemmatimonadota bacterium]